MNSNKKIHPTTAEHNHQEHNHQLNKNNQKQMNNQCPSCHSHQQNNNLICYACCYQLACQQCYQPEHFLNCDRQFNKHTLSLNSEITTEQNKQKKHGKSNKINQKCKRCEQYPESVQYCSECKTSLCTECSTVVHAKGKFASHNRTVSQSPQKIRRLQTFKTQNIEEETLSRRDKKENYENQEYGFKARDKPMKNNPSLPNKKGRSIAKTPFQNQENTPLRHKRKNSFHSTDAERKSCPIREDNATQQYPWLLCSKHNKLRNVLTQFLDLICSECYEDLKHSISKIKTVEFESWLQTDLAKANTDLCMEGVLQYTQQKSTELSLQFQRYRKELQNQYKQKQQILQERYKNSLSNLQKWNKMYNDSLTSINNKCQHFTSILNTLQKDDNDLPTHQKTVKTVSKLQSLLLYEEILKLKKEYSSLQEQYQFKVTEISSEQFEESLKSFSFVRKKIDSELNQPKNVNKISQSAQLRQSRISNSSIATDRKCIKRDDSMAKSSYYDMSHSNLLRLSRAKENNQELMKDISQRILFPSDKKEKPELKSCTTRQKNSYFFQTAPEHNKIKIQPRQTDSSEVQFKDVKYINLETIITEKLQKKHQNTEMITSVTIESNNTHPEHQKQETSQHPILNDARMIQSITVPQTAQNNNNHQSRGSVPIASSNHSLQSVKNKRKSDYMQMRDRLRKPSIMTKIGK